MPDNTAANPFDQSGYEVFPDNKAIGITLMPDAAAPAPKHHLTSRICYDFRQDRWTIELTGRNFTLTEAVALASGVALPENYERLHPVHAVALLTGVPAMPPPPDDPETPGQQIQSAKESFALGVRGIFPLPDVIETARALCEAALTCTDNPEITLDEESALRFKLRTADNRLILADLDQLGNLEVSVYDSHDHLIKTLPTSGHLGQHGSTTDELIRLIREEHQEATDE